MSRVTRFAIFTLVAALLCAAALATGALATTVPPTGASVGTAADLAPFMGSTLTTGFISESASSTTGEYYFRLSLNKGQTVSADITSTPFANIKAHAWISHAGYYNMEADAIDLANTRLTFMAPIAGVYNIYVSASAATTFTIKPRYVAPVAYKFSTYTVPTSGKKNTKFGVSIKMWPDYDGPISPVTFTAFRKVSGKYKSTKIVGSSFSGGDATYTRMSGSFTLGKGTYYVQAKFADAAHPKAWTSAYKKIVIK